LLPPGKKPPIYWIFEFGFIFDLPWDPGDWHWQSTRNMGDVPFFGYSSKKGYQNARKKITPLASLPSSRTWVCTTRRLPKSLPECGTMRVLARLEHSPG
jgi:hypothetical protein